MLSVIIPTFMEEKYLERTMQSIENQNYEDYETIVVDSNSTDKTVTIARKYADKVYVIKKRGIGTARNFGMKKAKGNILLFLDADTFFVKNNIFRKIEEAFKDKRVVCFSGKIQCMGNKIHKLIFSLANNLSRFSVKINYPLFYGMTVACRKETFKKIGGFDEKIKIAEDVDMSRRIKKEGKCVFDKNLIGMTYPRRIEKMGFWNFLKSYVFKGASLFLLKKPATEDAPVTR